MTPIPEKNIFWFDIEEFIQIVAALFRTLFPLKKEEIKQLKNHINLLEEGLKIKIDQKEFINSIYKKVSNYRLLKRIIRSLLLKVKPRAIFQVVHYALPNLIINEQAKRLGIPTIELQHGVLGDYNIAYHFNFAIKSPFFPDYFSVFGNYWKNVTKLPVEAHCVLVTGFPHLWETKIRLNKSKSEKRSVKQFLIISQGTIGQDLSKFVKEFVTSELFPDINILYKLHPSEYDIWRDLYPNLVNEKITVIDNDQISLYEYFTIADWVLGVYSTAIFEALFYGLTVYILKTDGYQYLDDLIKKGIVQFVEKPEDLSFDTENFAANNISGELCSSDWEKNFRELLKYVEIIED